MQQKTMRVAIQLYGHLRSFEETYQSLFQHIVELNRPGGIEFDIFIHTWDEIDSIQKAPAYYNKDMAYAGLKITDQIKDRIKSAYNPRALLIEPQIPLTKPQLEVIEANNYNLALCQAFRNVSRSFCAVNGLRQSYEKANGVAYDLVIVTRPDIVFYRPLHLGPFYNREYCWQFFDDDALRSYVFSTYINGVHSVIRPDTYVAGLDLLLMAVPSVCDKLAEWEASFDDLINHFAETALITIMNRHGLRHSYFIYEKDKCWTILRLGAKQKSILDKIVNYLYFKSLPYLLRSKLFCQHTYTNMTTMRNMKEFRRYLLNHLDIDSRRKNEEPDRDTRDS